MQPLLYYTPGTCAFACMVALEWLGAPYALCRVEKEVRASPAYGRVHPRNQVPAMRVQGQVLVEANAILTHVAERGGDKGLLPSAGWERDVANQYLAYFASGFHAVFWPYFRPDRYTVEAAHEASVKAAAVLAIRRELSAMDALLATRPFVLGDTRSVLDPYLHAMDRWANPIVDMPKEYPHVFRHQKAMAGDPAVRFCLAVERKGEPDLTGSACVAHTVFTGDEAEPRSV